MSQDGQRAPGRVDVDAGEVSQAVGRRARELRRGLGLTMAKFAERAGLSLGMLSKIEHGQTAPSLSTLVRLANAANVPVTSLLRGLEREHDVVIVRAGQGNELLTHQANGHQSAHDLGRLRGPNQVIEPTLVELSGESNDFPLSQHSGAQLIHVLAGSMEYTYGASTYVLSTGDTMQISGEVEHGPASVTGQSVQFLTVRVYPDVSEA